MKLSLNLTKKKNRVLKPSFEENFVNNFVTSNELVVSSSGISLFCHFFIMHLYNSLASTINYVLSVFQVLRFKSYRGKTRNIVPISYIDACESLVDHGVTLVLTIVGSNVFWRNCNS